MGFLRCFSAGYHFFIFLCVHRASVVSERLGYD